MRLTSWRIIVISLVICLAILQLIHMSLMSCLIEPNTRLLVVVGWVGLGSAASVTSKLMTSQDAQLQHLMGKVITGSLIDSSGQYKIITNLVVGDNSDQRSDQLDSIDVALVTQCSTERLHYLPKMAANWNGPLSVTIFINDVTSQQLSSTLLTIINMRQCDEYVRNNITFNLVYPLIKNDVKTNTNYPVVIIRSETDCNRVTSKTENEKYSDDVIYPNNLLRNVALDALIADFVLVIDIDITPSFNLRQQFQRFIVGQNLEDVEKTAYVLPVYELLSGSRMPRDKRQLLEAIERSEARPFYVDVCRKCQMNTDYERWQNQISTQTTSGSTIAAIGVIYDRLWKDPWEPFYIVRNQRAPAYDERFKQYGFNRISQVCETHVAGFNFSIMDNAFLIHSGFKTRTGFQKTKHVQMERNRLLFRQFKVELKMKYPQSTRRCY